MYKTRLFCRNVLVFFGSFTIMDENVCIRNPLETKPMKLSKGILILQKFTYNIWVYKPNDNLTYLLTSKDINKRGM